VELAHRKASTYVGQHNTENADIHLCFEPDSNPQYQCFSVPVQDIPYAADRCVHLFAVRLLIYGTLIAIIIT
jgi:hypothetical protein